MAIEYARRSVPFRVASPPTQPVLIFDDSSRFGRQWAERWREWGPVWHAFSASAAHARFPDIPAELLAHPIALIEPQGRVLPGARGACHAAAVAGLRHWPAWTYERFAPFAGIADAFYRFAGAHPNLAAFIDRILLGRPGMQRGYFLAQWLFLRLIGVVYLIAFLSLLVQIDGLVGSRGILPAGQFLHAVRTHFGPERYRLLPTLCWINAGDTTLLLLCLGGALLGGIAALGYAQAEALFLSWLFYLSLCKVSWPFLGYQWDALLLEAGFLAIFYAPLRLTPGPIHGKPSRVLRWLLWWLLFRVMFLSGVLKWTSHDEAWRSMTAMYYHYFTQPIPPWTAWYAHHLPEWFQRFSTRSVFFLECFVPPCIFGPRWLRLGAFWFIAGFQLLIAATGNYGFFNLLTIVLCVPLVDDAAWPRKWVRWLRPEPTSESAAAASVPRYLPRRWPSWIVVPIGASLLVLTTARALNEFGIETRPRALRSAEEFASPFEIANGYGLFRVMTTQRPEIVIVGSDDGYTWLPYEFKYKPGDRSRRPPFFSPHMPRLDWQMWFCSLGSADAPNNQWIFNFTRRLLQGSPEVLALMERNPFPDHPPKYVKAVLYEYTFTTSRERRRTGDWWIRHYQWAYFPALSLKDFGGAAADDTQSGGE